MKHPFFQDIRIPFHLCDPAGIVFFGNVFPLSHLVYESFIIDKLQCSWDAWFKNLDWFVPIKHASADYKIPLHAGVNYQVEVTILGVKSSSFTVHYRFLHGESEHCVVEIVHVFCDRKTKKKIEIPPSIRSKLGAI